MTLPPSERARTVTFRLRNLCDKFCEFFFTNWLRPTYASQKYAIFSPNSPNISQPLRSLVTLPKSSQNCNNHECAAAHHPCQPCHARARIGTCFRCRNASYGTRACGPKCDLEAKLRNWRWFSTLHGIRGLGPVCTGLGKRVVPRLRELTPRGQMESVRRRNSRNPGNTFLPSPVLSRGKLHVAMHGSCLPAYASNTQRMDGWRVFHARVTFKCQILSRASPPSPLSPPLLLLFK